MSTAGEVWSESCSICEGRVFTTDSYWSDKCSCWECKSTFSKMTSSVQAFHCCGNGNCLVTRLTRFHCFYCFVKKCVSTGFATGCIWHQGLNNTGSLAPAQHPCGEPVRIITVGVEFDVQNPSDWSLSSEDVEPESADRDCSFSDIYNTIWRVVSSHMKFCPMTAEKTRHLPLETSSSAMAVEQDEVQETTVPHSEAESRCSAIFRNLANNMQSLVWDVAQFLQCLPGYEHLSTDDKIFLLKGGFFKVWLLWNVCSFLSPSKQQLTLNKNSFTFSELSDIYSVEFVRGLFDFAHSWSSLGVKDAVVGLCAGIVLSTVSLTKVDNSWNCARRVIQDTQELLTKALRQLLKQINPTKANLTEQVLQLVSALDSISHTHGKFLKKFHNHWRHLGVPPLFAEVFDFPLTGESGSEMVSLSEETGNDNEDMLCGEAETFENQAGKEGAGSQSCSSNQAAEDEYCSELGNLGDVSCSDVMSNVSNESEGELGNYREPSQGDLCTIEKLFRDELSKDGEVSQDGLTEDEEIFPRDLKDFFHRELFSRDEDIFPDKLGKDIFLRELSKDEVIFENELRKDEVIFENELSKDEVIFENESKDEVIFENELSKDAVHIELSEDEDMFQSESRDSADLSFIVLSPEHVAPNE